MKALRGNPNKLTIKVPNKHNTSPLGTFVRTVHSFVSQHFCTLQHIVVLQLADSVLLPYLDNRFPLDLPDTSSLSRSLITSNKKIQVNAELY